MIDLELLDVKTIWEKFILYSLADKAPRNWSKEDIVKCVEICCEAYKRSTSWNMPYYENGELHIPFDAPEKFQYWKHELSDKEKYDLLISIGVPEDKITHYMSQRAINVALGKCNAMGKTLKK